MKKVITTTLLLAAGTAFANAATVLTTFGHSTATGEIQQSDVTVTNTWSDGTTAASSISGGTYTGNDRDVGFLFGGAVGGDTSFIAPWTVLTRGWYLTYTIDNSSGKLTVVDEIALTVGAYTHDGGNGSWLTGSRTENVSFTVTFLDNTTSLGEFTGTWSLSGSSDYSKQVVTLTNSSGSVDVSNVSNLSVKISTPVISGMNSSNNPFGVGLYSAAVPEPSAFGLLAGLGALALVASRRRRSRK